MSSIIYNSFILNKYSFLYFKLLDNPNRNNNSYIEKHHILPKSIYPEYAKESWNIISISAREHYIAHLLLYKYYKSIGDKSNMHKMLSAWTYMAFGGNTMQPRITSRKYSYLRKIISKNMSGSGNPFYNKTHTEESRKKISRAKKGVPANHLLKNIKII